MKCFLTPVAGQQIQVCPSRHVIVGKMRVQISKLCKASFAEVTLVRSHGFVLVRLSLVVTQCDRRLKGRVAVLAFGGSTGAVLADVTCELTGCCECFGTALARDMIIIRVSTFGVFAQLVSQCEHFVAPVDV